MPVAITGAAFNRASATFFGWVRQRSQARRRRNGFAYCDSYEIERIAKDVGLTTMELSRLAQFGPNAARLLLDRMAAQNLDVETISKIDPSTMRDLQRLCSICSTKKRCQRDLRYNRADPVWQQYCLNFGTIAVLQDEPAKYKVD
jgi:hypothetical protein